MILASFKVVLVRNHVNNKFVLRKLNLWKARDKNVLQLIKWSLLEVYQGIKPKQKKQLYQIKIK
jgi:hypothetical protein